MIEQLRIQNFKSWRDTGTIRFTPITGFFGANSSGKTSLLHFLLMLKQTVESTDRQQIMKLDGPYTDLGTFEDLIYQHDTKNELSFSIMIGADDKDFYGMHAWIYNLSPQLLYMQNIDHANFSITLKEEEENILIKNIYYDFTFGNFNLEHMDDNKYLYHSYLHSVTMATTEKHIIDLQPNKLYNMPFELHSEIGDLYFLQDFSAAFERCFFNTRYLGPLRDYPKRSYLWNGSQVSLGNQGENAVFVLIGDQKRTGKSSTEKTVAIWLKQLGLIHGFRVHRIAKNRRDYEVRIQIKEGSPEVLLTEVGFGVSQILPVLVLCATAEAGSTIILEQPEIHLHPAVQAGLADILIETSQRSVQVILESHSEHLLRRLQRRIAEAKLTPAETALYFCESDKTGTSQLKPLDVDAYGNINNWPEHFFGDEMGDLAAMTIAAMERQIAEGHQ